MKREASFQILFRHWLKANPHSSAVFELKQTTTDSIPFSSVKPHQVRALLATKGETGIIYKIPDDSRSEKPFDMFSLNDTSAFVVIKYPDCFTIIDIDDFIGEELESKRKSLTSVRAQAIAIEVVIL